MSRITVCRLATVCIPWDESGRFLEERFRTQLRSLLGSGFENLYLFGTAGEGYAVTERMFSRIATIFYEEMRASPGLCQLGVIGLSTAQIRERIELGLHLGFRSFQISLPAWGTLNDRELARFFHDTLGAYPEAQFLHYNTSRAGRILSGAEYACLVAEYPNLVATKSGGHSMASLLALQEKAPELCHFLTELDYAAACLLGITCGLLVSVSAIHPARSLEFFLAGQKQDRDTLERLTLSLNSVRNRIIEEVARAGGHMDGAYDKIYARLLDPGFPLDLLSPYQGAGLAAFEAFKTWLEAHAPEWAMVR